MPSNKSVRAKKAAPASKAAPAARAAAPTSKSVATNVWSAWAIAGAIVAVVIVAALFAAREPAPVRAAAVVDGPQPATAPSTAPVKRVADRKVADAVDPPAASARIPGSVDVTGCLQRDKTVFVLKDTAGAAPRSRSWKTGFLKKSSASIELTDTGHAAHLSDHVGQRVSVTGTLIDREMHVQSVRRLAATCG